MYTDLYYDVSSDLPLRVPTFSWQTCKSMNLLSRWCSCLMTVWPSLHLSLLLLAMASSLWNIPKFQLCRTTETIDAVCGGYLRWIRDADKLYLDNTHHNSNSEMYIFSLLSSMALTSASFRAAAPISQWVSQISYYQFWKMSTMLQVLLCLLDMF